MSGFSFVGALPASKSMLNRALIIQSFAPELEVIGDSSAEDVRLMRAGLVALREGRPIECGHAGTVFRFMALRAAREPGVHTLSGRSRLFERPQADLLKILRQLGCQVELTTNTLKIESWGWKVVGDAIHVPGAQSSQFASALLLSAWQLPFQLFAFIAPDMVSAGYFQMTLALAQQAGMKFDFWGSDLRVPTLQAISAKRLIIEPDMSSAFALCAAAAVGGQATVTGFPEKSLQPDRIFVELLQQMGCRLRVSEGTLRVEQSENLRGLKCNLGQTPDLFPVLGALCALAEGESELRGAAQLVHKESDRLSKTAELIRLVGRDVQFFSDGLVIKAGRSKKANEPVVFDPDQDHRMAMAAAVLATAGLPIEILHREVVEKSYPDFWHAIGWAE